MLDNHTQSNAKLAWHFFKQEYHYSHQKLLRIVQCVLLIFVVTLSLTSESIQGYLTQNLAGLLGADAVISQKQAMTSEQLNQVTSLTEKVAITQQIKTTLTHQNQWQQAQLKAVGSNYPLQGELITSSDLNGSVEVTVAGPSMGHIWLDARLFAGLSVNVGESLMIAEQSFIISRVIQHEPDRLMEGHSVAMRAMINSEDMHKLNFPSDLIQYRYLLAANKSQVNELMQWQETFLPAAQIFHKQGKHPLALFWQRTENFLGLASIILFFMAGVAIEQLSQVHKKKEQYFSAICMSLGASKYTGLYISIAKWLISVLMLIPFALIISSLIHYGIIQFLNDTFPELIWQINGAQMIKPVIAVVFVFAVFYLPVWLALVSQSCAKQLLGFSQKGYQWLGKVCSLLVLVGVSFYYSDNGLLTFMLLSVIVATIGLLILSSWASLTLGEKATQQVSGLLPFALYMMKQRLVSKGTQILGVGLCAFLLLFTLMLLKDLGGTMSAYQRQHDGNVFVSQASKSQMSYVEAWSKENDITIRQVKPYMQAKVVEINNQSLAKWSDKPSDSLATLSQSIRLHWSEQVPSNNLVVSGTWWQESSENWQQLSVEQEVMTDLGLALGDTLTLFINQQRYSFEITASHVFKPGAGSITFWLQMSPEALRHIQASHYHMASLELKEHQWPLLGELWQKFPSLRMVSLKEMTQLFDQTLAMVTQVISGFAFMVILLSCVVMFASINALESKERKKNSVIMSLGFAKSTCFKLNMIEWLVTALIAAFGAIVGTYIAGLLIYQSQFSLTYQPDVAWLLITLFIIMSSVTLLGVIASRNTLRSSVRQLMSNT